METADFIAIGSLIIIGVVLALLKRKEQANFVQRCTRKLHDENWKVRQDIVHEITRELANVRRYNSRHLAKLLLKALQDEDWRVRYAAARTLEQELDMYCTFKIYSTHKYYKKNRQTLSIIPVISPLIKPLVVKAFIRTIRDQHPEVRKEAVIALGKTRDVRAIFPLLKAVKDADADVRKEAVIALGKKREARIIQPLLKALKDDNETVRRNAARALEKSCKLVHTIVFGRGRSLKDSKQKHTVRNPDVANLMIPMVNLRQIVIDATTCNVSQVEAFARYTMMYLDKPSLKQHVAISIDGDPTRFNAEVYDLCHRCNDVNIRLETLIFGAKPLRSSPTDRTAAYNPDLSTFTFPMLHIKRVIIETSAYDFHLVERFLTYAVNYMGRKYLKKHVEVYIYDDPEKLHPNLRNNLTHLCKHVHVHKKGERFPYKGVISEER